jgi:hypothetical protein
VVATASTICCFVIPLQSSPVGSLTDRFWSLNGVQTAAKDTFGVHLASKSGGLKSFVFIGGYPQVIDIFCLGARGPGFKSRQPDQIPQRLVAS